MLTLEPLLRARLAEITGLKGVHGLADLNAEKTKPTPCVYVIYDGAAVAELNAPATEARLVVRWLIVLAVKNVAKAADGAAVREDAQALAGAVLTSLMGWRPDAAHQALRLVDLPSPDYSGGMLLLPLVFETLQFVKKDA